MLPVSALLALLAVVALLAAVIAMAWRHGANARWFAVWQDEVRAMGLSMTGGATPDDDPREVRVTGEIDGRALRVQPLTNGDASWHVRVELRLRHGTDEATGPLRQALRRLHSDPENQNDGWFAMEVPGRHDRPGQLRRLIDDARQAAGSLEALE